MKININPWDTQPQYNPFSKTVDIPGNLGANEIRHELVHAGLALTPDLFSAVGSARRFASTPLGTLMGATNSLMLGRERQRMLAETAAITMGGAAAYPGFQPAFRPQQFADVFNTQVSSWQYPAAAGWNITPESKWKTYR